MSAAKRSRRSSESEYVGFRLAREELEFLDDQAARFGLSRSAFLRFLISLSPELVTSYEKAHVDLDSEALVVVPMVYQVDLDKMQSELRKQGVNLNQAVKAVNTIARAVHTRKDDELPLLLNGIQQKLHEVAELYDEFDEEFFDFKERTSTIGPSGYVGT